MAIETLVVTEDHMTMDKLLWRRFMPVNDGHRADIAYAADAQQDLAEAGPILPIGTKVTIDAPPPGAKRTPVRVIRLWSPAVAP